MATYGNHVKCREHQIQEAKEVLTEELLDTVRALTKEDAFWEITRILNTDEPEDVIVGYKFSIPADITTTY